MHSILSARPETVAIVALGTSHKTYVAQATEAGGRRRLYDEVWAINAMGGVIQHDRLFAMDDLATLKEGTNGNHLLGHVTEIARWARLHPGPIYTRRLHPEFPGAVVYPFAEVMGSIPHAYLNTTVAYAIALAIHLGVKRLGVFGADFTYPDLKLRHIGESGRACVEFLLGFALARGIAITIPEDTTLCDARAPLSERFYGLPVIERDGALVLAETPEPEPVAVEAGG